MTLFIVTLSEHLYLEKFGLAFFFFFFKKQQQHVDIVLFCLVFICFYVYSVLIQL